MGEVIVRLTVNKKSGTYEAKVLGHEGRSNCGEGIDEDIIEDLLNAEVPGYGHMVEHEDSGHTCEYFEERQAKQNPHKYKYNQDSDDGDEDEDEIIDNKELDNGFGV